MENINQFNKEMIALGLMREATNAEKQYFKKFGEELTTQEYKCYKIICSSGIEPVLPCEIGKRIFGGDENCVEIKEANIRNAWTLVDRIKRKLGPSEIICKFKYGYISRRMVISDMVNKNLEKEKK